MSSASRSLSDRWARSASAASAAAGSSGISIRSARKGTSRSIVGKRHTTVADSSTPSDVSSRLHNSSAISESNPMLASGAVGSILPSSVLSTRAASATHCCCRIAIRRRPGSTASSFCRTSAEPRRVAAAGPADGASRLLSRPGTIPASAARRSLARSSGSTATCAEVLNSSRSRAAIPSSGRRLMIPCAASEPPRAGLAARPICDHGPQSMLSAGRPSE